MTIPNTHSAAFAIPGLRIASLNQNFIYPFEEESITDAVCTYFHLTREDLGMRCRKNPLPMARQICCYLMIKHAKSTTVYLGKKFGQDHTTITVANQLVKDQLSLKHDNRYKQAVKEILKML